MKNIIKFTTIGSIGFGGYYLGSHSERKKIISLLHDNFNSDRAILENIIKPSFSLKWIKFPSFSTVSAATPIPSRTAIVSGSGRISQIMKFGFPGMENLRSFDDYILSYDRRNRVPHWVFEHLTKESLKHNDSIDRSQCDFAPDESIHKYFRSENSDYKGSGYDRGHMAAAGNHKLAQKHVEQTFLLTNIAPQVGKGFNRNIWNQLEKYIRKLTNTYTNVYCCTGPLYLPRTDGDGKNYIKYQVIGSNSVAVPTHFYKIILAETTDGQFDLECYCMPNQPIADSTSLQLFHVSVDTIERAAGLLFFDKIPKNNLRKINGKKV